MNFFLKSSLAIILFLVVVSPAAAEERDYLLITGRYQNGMVSIESVDQRVLDSVPNFLSGSYKAELYDNNNLVGSNFFEITEGEREIVPSEDEKEYDTFTPESVLFSVVVPLQQSVPLSARIVIKQENQILTTKRLEEVPFEILALKDYRIIIPEPSISFPPFPATTWFDETNLLFLVLGILILLILTGGVYWFIFRRPKTPAAFEEIQPDSTSTQQPESSNIPPDHQP